MNENKQEKWICKNCQRVNSKGSYSCELCGWLEKYGTIVS